MNKYKLIKTYPNSPEIGSIYYNTFKNENIIKQIENHPEFWAKHMFTTEDNVDIFIGDKYYYTTKNKDYVYSGICDSHSGGLVVAHGRLGDKYFSTKEVADEYLKSLYNINKWFKRNKHDLYVLITNKEKNVGFVCGEWGEINATRKQYGVCDKGTWETFDTDKSLIINARSKSWKWFESSKDRDEYIELNKPLYSLNDLLSTFEFMWDNTSLPSLNLSIDLIKFIYKNKIISSISNIINDIKKIVDDEYYCDLYLSDNNETINMIISVNSNEIKNVSLQFFKINEEMKNPNINKFINVSFE